MASGSATHWYFFTPPSVSYTHLDVYKRQLSVLAEESDYIQSRLFKNSLKLSKRKTGIKMCIRDRVNRLLAMESHVDSQNMRTGNLKDEDWTKLVEGADIIGRSNLIIDDTPGISIAEMRSKCRKYKLEHNLGIIMIDYLQLMSGSGKSDSRQQEISDISRSLKALARELGVPVIALSQFCLLYTSFSWERKPLLADSVP